MIHISPTLSPLLFVRSLFSSSENILPNIIQFSYARGALIGAINSIIVHYNLKPKPTVWVPTFICDTVIYLLESYNVKIAYYPITMNLEPNWSETVAGSFSEGDIFLLVHYFGFEMPTKKAVNFCKKNKMFLIEDCAHSIVPRIEKDGIGTHGDAAIFGLRKALPIPHGGFLYMKNIKYIKPYEVSGEEGIYRSTYKMMIQWLLCKLKFKKIIKFDAIRKGKIQTFPKNYSLFNFQEDMDIISRKITNTVKIKDILVKRTNNYLYYKKHLANISNIVVPNSFEIKKNQTTPWVFFFYYDKAEELINFLLKYGIPASDFPAMHPNVVGKNEYSLEYNLYLKSVTLPVHQDLSENDLDYIIKKIQEFEFK